MAAGYGVGMWCTDQIRSGRRAYGKTIVAHALYRRLITPRGTLRGGDLEAAYGFDVAGYVGAVGVERAARSLPAQVRAELMKDDRVADVSVAATISTERNGLAAITLEINAVLADETGDFTLTLAVSDVTVAILGGVS